MKKALLLGLVASLSASSLALAKDAQSYIGVGIGHIEYVSGSYVDKGTNTGTSRESKVSTLGIKTLQEFYAKGYWENGLVTGIRLSDASEIVGAAELTLGYLLTPELEAGLSLAINYKSETREVGSNESTTKSNIMRLGGYGVYTLPLDVANLELDAGFGIYLGSGKTETNGTSQETADISGFDLYAQAGFVLPAGSKNFNFVPAARFAYGSVTNTKVAEKKEEKNSRLGITLLTDMRFYF